jgi:multidrug transporter EmrE-like cation transporter
MSKYTYLFLPVLFSVAAQLLIKHASLKELRTPIWTLIITGSVFAYLLAFIFYTITLRFFPISIASPVNTILVMVFVVLGGIYVWDEPWGIQRTLGVFLGVASLIILLSSK